MLRKTNEEVGKSKFYLFICLLMAVQSLRCCVGFSLAVESGDYSPIVIRGPLMWWLFLLWSSDPRAHRLQ